MLEPWNDASILPPPVYTCPSKDNIVDKYQTAVFRAIADAQGLHLSAIYHDKENVENTIIRIKEDYSSMIDIQELTYTCNTMIKVLSKQAPLHQESAIFSRFLYKYDKKFRSDIGYRNFKKVNTALRKYLVLNLLKDVENFIAMLPSNDDEIYLPTRQMLEYVLVRLMTFSKLMLRICVCSKQASVFYLDRVKRGESHWMSLMPYAMLSRVWTMSKVLLQHSCNWYSNLYTFLDKLQLKGLDFLPSGYNLPTDLDGWLDMSNLDDFGKFEWSQKKRLEIDTGLVEDKEGDRFDNILEYVNQINSEENDETEVRSFSDKLRNSDQIRILSGKNVDHGQVISRDSFKRLSNVSSVSNLLGKTVDQRQAISKDSTKLSKVIPVSLPSIKHYAERVTNKESLLEFINTEDKLRTETSSQSLTSHLSFMQWQTLKNSLLKLHESLSKNRKIERKFKKIWQEKCLDYK